MTEAIASVFPATRHAFCLWHITQKFGKWFGNILGSKMEVFCKDFYTAANAESESSFGEAWTVLVSKNQLQDNNRIQNLHVLRASWLPCVPARYIFRWNDDYTAFRIDQSLLQSVHERQYVLARVHW